MTPSRFKNIRLELGLKQTELAALLFISSRHLRRYERGITPIPELKAKYLENLTKGYIEVIPHPTMSGVGHIYDFKWKEKD